MKVKIVTWKKRKVIVITENNKRVAWRYLKGSKLTKKSALDLYKNNRTLQPGLKKLRNVTVQTELEPSKVDRYGAIDKRAEFGEPKKPKRWRKGVIQYVISGDIVRNGKHVNITVSSGGEGTNDEKVARAQKAFLGKLGEHDGKYDEDEGISKLSDVKNLQEGWERFY